MCKYVSLEFEERLKETGQTSEVLETGYGFDKEKKKTEYKRSELRLIETMESVCDRLLSYNVHKERKDSTRFARGVSQTFQTLNDLVDRGVYLIRCIRLNDLSLVNEESFGCFIIEL